MSAGGRFTRPTSVQVAEDGDAEYIIPVRKEDRALPLLRQLLGELSPAARESLSGSGGIPSFSGGLSAGESAGSVTVYNQHLSAPVNIHVTASAGKAEEIGRSIYPPITENQIVNAVNQVLTFLGLVGVLVDPTTVGIGDSDRAMGYTEPWDDRKE